MSHLGLEALRRILGGEGGAREAENAAEHVVSCDRCRALAGTLLEELRAESPGLQGEGSLQLVFDLIDRERQWGVESLAAIAEWAELRHLPSRRGQRDRVRMTKACHTIAFFNLVLSELNEESSWEEAEFLAGLALLSIEAMSQRQQIGPVSHDDLLLRVECLIEVRKPVEALQVFRRCSRLFIANPRARMRIRGRFTGARLLDALGFKPQAERLFDEVIDRDVEHELYKDAFLDLLYLYGYHVQAGDLEKAARVCQRALTDSALSEVAHEQLRDLWTQLLAAAQRRAISQDLLRDLRQYLSVHWKHPAASPPVVAFR